MCIARGDHTFSYSSSPPRSSILLVSASSSNSYAPYIYDPCPPTPPPEPSSTPDHSDNAWTGLGQKARRVGKSIKEKGEQFLRVAEGSSFHSGSPRLTYDHGARVGEDINITAIFKNMGMTKGFVNRQTTGRPLAGAPRPEPDHRIESEAAVAEPSGYRAFNGRPTPVVAVYPDTPDHYNHLGRIPDGTGIAPAELPEDGGFVGVAVAEKRYYEMFDQTYPPSSPSAPLPAENPNPARPSRAAAEKVRAARGGVPAATNGRAPYPLSPANGTGSEMRALQHRAEPVSQKLDRHRKPVPTVSVEKPGRSADNLIAPKEARISLHFGTDVVLPSASTISLPNGAQIAELSGDADTSVSIEQALRRDSRSLPELKLDLDLDITAPYSSRSNNLDSISNSVAKGEVRNADEAASSSTLDGKAQKQQPRISSGVLPDQTPLREVIQAATREHLLSTETKALQSGNTVSQLERESPKIKSGLHNTSPQSAPRSNVIAETKVDDVQIATAQSLRRVKAAGVKVRSLAGPVPLGQSQLTTATGSLLDGPVPSSLQSKQLSNRMSTVDGTRRNWNWGRFIDTDYEDPSVAHSRHFREKKAWAKHNNGALIVFSGDEKEKEEKRKSLMSLMKEKSIGELLDFFEGKK